MRLQEGLFVDKVLQNFFGFCLWNRELFLREDTRKVKEKEYMHKWSVSTPEQRVHFYSTTHPVSRRTQEPTHAR